MRVRGTTAFSRVCPACARRVPQHVVTCRCGAVLPAEVPANDDTRPQLSKRSPAVALIGPVLFVIIGVAAWYQWGSARPELLNHPAFHRSLNPPPPNRSELLEPIVLGAPPKQPDSTSAEATSAAPPRPAAEATRPPPRSDRPLVTIRGVRRRGPLFRLRPVRRRGRSARRAPPA